MSKARVAVLKVISKELTVTAAAAAYGYSRQHLHKLLARYHTDGLDAVEPQSRRPKSNPNAIPATLGERIVELRLELTGKGLDAGPVTIAWHLEQEGLRVPSTSTIRRVLHAEGLIDPEPRKRPRSSYRRFVADQPNECWQSDFTHWTLADGTGVEILNWLDDHSRFLLSSTAHAAVSGDLVVSTFLDTASKYGYPASTLTDNGRVYTARTLGGRNAFEHLLSLCGITQKNGNPGHPQTQGKIERFHQTQKKWLTNQPPATTLKELQTQLDTLTRIYNHERPHRELANNTPATAYQSTPKTEPQRTKTPGHYRLRYDRVDKTGKITIRHASKLHHLGIGRTHTKKRVLAITDPTTITVIELDTGEILSTHNIEPTKTYWRNQQKPPGRWPTKQED